MNDEDLNANEGTPFAKGLAGAHGTRAQISSSITKKRRELCRLCAAKVRIVRRCLVITLFKTGINFWRYKYDVIWVLLHSSSNICAKPSRAGMPWSTWNRFVQKKMKENVFLLTETPEYY